MTNEIIPYIEMCRREAVNLQRGMNYFGDRRYSVVLMSVRKGAPYRDRIEDEGRTLVYEGHNVPSNWVDDDPGHVDQPERHPGGSLTENGKFYGAAAHFKVKGGQARLVRVYEKLSKGIWSYNGDFLLTDAWREADERRQVFKFRLEVQVDGSLPAQVRDAEFEHNRLIPTAVKVAVWKRDKGQCTKCEATDGLHFDHILAYSKGGSSVAVENIQLLCARHNLQKSDRWE